MKSHFYVSLCLIAATFSCNQSPDPSKAPSPRLLSSKPNQVTSSSNVVPPSVPADSLTDFVNAACTGNAAVVATFLSHVPGLEVNGKDSDGRTALTCAIENQHADVTEALLSDSRVNPNVQDGKGQSPLVLAINEKNDLLVAELLGRFPALDYSAIASTPTAFLDLLGADGLCQSFVTVAKNPSANLNASDAAGKTPLMKLVEKTSDEAVSDQVGKCASDLFTARTDIDLEHQTSDGKNLLAVTESAYEWAEQTPFLHPMYARVHDLYAPRFFKATHLRNAKFARSNADLSRIAILTFRNADDPFGVIDGLQVYFDHDVSHPKAIQIPQKWAIACPHPWCEESTINQDFHFLFDSDQVAIDHQAAGCLLLGLKDGSQTELSREACDAAIAGRVSIDSALPRKDTSVSCSWDYNCFEHAQVTAIPGNSRVQVYEYDYIQDQFPSVLVFTPPSANPSSYFQTLGYGYVKIQGQGKWLLLTSAWGPDLVELLK